MNAALKSYLKEQFGLAADASDEDAKKLAVEKLASGELSQDKYLELVATKSKGDRVLDMLEKQGRLLEVVATRLTGETTKRPEADVQTDTEAAAELERLAKEREAQLLGQRSNGVRPEELLATADRSGGEPRVKAATERYTTTKTAVTWLDGSKNGKPGMPAYYFAGEHGTPTYIDYPSQAEYAKSGAWLKFMLRKAGAPVRLTEHDIHLVKEALHRDSFVGAIGSHGPTGKRRLSELEIKTVLDDSTSGGEEAVPEYFDDRIITTPLLHGELFPLVNVVNVPRGSSSDGFAMGTPTFVSTAEGSSVAEFTTTSFISAYDVDFFPATCAITLGLDFESDSVPDFAQTMLNQIGQEGLRWLDEQIAVGDGTTEPQGIFVASGTAVSSENGTAGDFTYNDALNLVHGIDKAHRNAFGGNRTVYVMHDTDYKKFMQIVTGVTGDTRPVFGMNLKDYMLGDYPVRVQNNITIGNVCFSNLGGYRMYRRQGLQFRRETAGKTLALDNEVLYVARMRWGGKITLTGYIAEMSDGDIYPIS